MRQLRSKFLVFSRALPLGQWPHPKDDASLGTPGSLAPDTKICAASFPNYQLLNSFGYPYTAVKEVDLAMELFFLPPEGPFDPSFFVVEFIREKVAGEGACGWIGCL